jgi:hypothetical protein
MRLFPPLPTLPLAAVGSGKSAAGLGFESVEFSLQLFNLAFDFFEANAF